MEAAILSMGEGAVKEILSNKKSIDVTCEYCNSIYEFDRIDVKQLFKIGRSGGLSEAFH